MEEFNSFRDLFVEKFHKRNENAASYEEITVIESKPECIRIKYREIIKNQNSYFECPFCLNLFIDEFYLKKHIIRKHNEILNISFD